MKDVITPQICPTLVIMQFNGLVVGAYGISAKRVQRRYRHLTVNSPSTMSNSIIPYAGVLLPSTLGASKREIRTSNPLTALRARVVTIN